MTVRVGDVGRAVSPMTPSGAVEVGGRQLNARSEGLYIAAGRAVVVLRGDPMGCIVREVEPGHPPPRLPDHGEPIAPGGPYRTSAEVAATDHREHTETARQARQRLQYGFLAAGTLGVLVGLASGGFGWISGRAGVAGPTDAAILLAGSAVGAAVLAAGLFAITGLVGLGLGAIQGEPEFAPSLLVAAVALIGAAVGFWWKFAGWDTGHLALWTAAAAGAGAVAAWVIKGLVGG